MNHIVAISGGKDSTAMAIGLKEFEPRDDYQFCITPTGRELPAMVGHWEKLERILGQPIIRIPNPPLLDLIKKFHALPNWQMRWCTRLVKIEPFIDWAINHSPAITHVGIRADEAQSRDGTNWDEFSLLHKQDFPMVRWGWDLSKVQAYLKEKDAVPPPRTDCDICFYQKLIEWFELWRDHPDRYQEGIALETWTGHTFRSAQRDSWPASMAGLAAEFAKGRIPKDTRTGQRKAMCQWCAR